MRRLLTLVLVVAAIAAAGPAWSQAAADKPAPAPAISAADANSALAVLTNDARRRELITTLETIAKAQGTQAAPPAASATPTHTATPAPTPAATSAPTSATTATAKQVLPQLLPGSLGEQIIVDSGSRLSQLGRSLSVTVRTVLDLPLLSYWFGHLIADPVERAELLDAAWRLALVLAVAIGAEYLAFRLLRGLVAALDRYAATERGPRRAGPATLLHRLPLVLGRGALELAPILAVAAVGYVLASVPIFADPTTRVVISAVLYAYIVCRLIMTLTRLLVAPDSPKLRLVHLPDEGARFVERWVRRLAVVAVFGYTFVNLGLLFGLYSIAHDALLRIVMLIVHLMLVVLILEARAPVARWLRAPSESRGVLVQYRNRVASTWHWIAIFYALALWFVWAFEISNGISRLIRSFVLTIIVAAVARLVGIAILGVIERALGSTELARTRPSVAARVRGYQPILRFAVGGVIVFFAVVLVLQVWGLDSLDWLESNPLGGQLLSAVVTVGAIILIALAIWEGANAAVEQHLDRLTREAQIARSARLRTLLPMLRTTLFAAIILFAGLTVLSEIGVNIAPLLAGAGVAGVAIGFGSQKLVQDVITGLFLLLENAMQVGDVVSLAGLSGTVENLSVRTIRLRALDGSVHVIPFSAVTTVTNMTRDYSYALVDVSVGLNEEPDHIADVLREIVQQMRREDRWSSAVRDELEVMGVEKFVDLAWVMRVRVKTLPAQRWAVMRELNRRVKYRFDELAIESPMTSTRALSMGTPPPAAETPPPSAASQPQPQPASAT